MLGLKETALELVFRIRFLRKQYYLKGPRFIPKMCAREVLAYNHLLRYYQIKGKSVFS